KPLKFAEGTRRFPARLSETGLFSSTKSMTPAPGVIPYSVNVPLWSDGAVKQRYLAFPVSGQVGFSDTGSWTFPDGTVVLKSFSMDLKENDPDSRLLLETRILVQTANGWEGYTYVWNEDQEDAFLIDASMTMPLDMESTGEDVQRNWYFPSRADCQSCHTQAGGFALSVTTRQLNRLQQYADGEQNQLERLESLGIFREPLPKRPAELDQYPSWESDTSPTEGLARAYLDVNCAFCHSPGGPGNSPIDLRFHTPLNQTSLIGLAPRGSRITGSPATAIVQPGRPEDSDLFRRMELRGPGQMPTLASFIKDARATELIADWIYSLPPGAR
ncbi:MAG: hypothetical protein KDA89_11865, partial [Planctomycetaceae bacterium]|nr:hypothetical protein [Planctomycetaceae bacterium]